MSQKFWIKLHHKHSPLYSKTFMNVPFIYIKIKRKQLQAFELKLTEIKSILWKYVTKISLFTWYIAVLRMICDLFTNWSIYKLVNNHSYLQICKKNFHTHIYLSISQHSLFKKIILYMSSFICFGHHTQIKLF